MKKLFKRVKSAIVNWLIAIKPGQAAIKGASYGSLIIAAIIWGLGVLITLSRGNDIYNLVIFLGMTILVVGLGYLLPPVSKLIYKIPANLKRAFLISIILISFPVRGYELSTYFVVMGALIGAVISVLKNTRIANLSRPKKIITFVGMLLAAAMVVASFILYIPEGWDVDKFKNAALESDTRIDHIAAPNPGIAGEYQVLTMSYGSGKDRHRAEFSDEVDITTEPVDGVAFLDDWDGIGGWYRKFYWGHDDRALPLNARVWYPEGDGPFPLALVVHGNHGMQDYSDPGYDYLGELLASRGIILASVDENFINGAFSNIFGGLSKENDCRGWLLLEHLRVWHEWNVDPENQFYQKVDTSKLALIGHSRGGEAVGHAASFNALPYYPDDASVKFDYNFDLKAVIAIAPVDGQYQPGNSRDKFENVNYFTFHGSQDADVTSFSGTRQYERVSYTDSLYHFKSALWIYGANHGQFNTSWGSNDIGIPFTRLLNLKQLMSKENQEQIAEVYISAFLETSFYDKREYLPLFSDWRTGKDWLPETTYLLQFEDSSFELITDYEEDFDLTTTSTGNGLLQGRNTTIWKEKMIDMVYGQKDSRGVVLGWNYEDYISDLEDSIAIADLPDSIMASYSIRLDTSDHIFGSESVFSFMMAESTESSNPKSGGKWVNENENNNRHEQEENNEDGNENENGVENVENGNAEDEVEDESDEDEEEIEEPINFSIRFTDIDGKQVTVGLESFSLLQREINIKHSKIDFLWDENSSENIFQTFRYSINDLNLSRIIEIEFVFNQQDSGVVLIDRIGIAETF